VILMNSYLCVAVLSLVWGEQNINNLCQIWDLFMTGQGNPCFFFYDFFLWSDINNRKTVNKQIVLWVMEDEV
jgi:hypothetical protein